MISNAIENYIFVVKTTQGGTFVANTTVDALQRTPLIVVGGVELTGRATASGSLGVPRALAATPSVVYKERSTSSPMPLTMTSSNPAAAPSASTQRAINPSGSSSLATWSSSCIRSL
ncbi:hypothetical protein Cni_G17069 [Canna indica]|uniref:Uncharacterized protein n=1 Tax=Canna indica TaxID=4628 RepID=A0AAQ3QD72_9LILI|nr:hypothetical protein Cni_G17069 [Canna indica]